MIHFSSDLQGVDPKNIKESFRALGPSMVVTQGCFESLEEATVEDLDWNNMDQTHRPWIHHTYLHALHLIRGKCFSLSLTRAGWWPFFTLVANVHLGPGLFYQSFSIFSVFYVHCFTQTTSGGDKTIHRLEWFVVSHKIFRLFHRWIHRKLHRLNKIQNAEDTPIRLRRKELRARGFEFSTACPDFINSNLLHLRLKRPALKDLYRIAIGTEIHQTPRKVNIGPMDLLVLRDREGGLNVWHAECPHEGGPLEKGRICDGAIECPWHGLKSPGTRLTPMKPRANLGNLDLALEPHTLVVSQAE